MLTVIMYRKSAQTMTMLIAALMHYNTETRIFPQTIFKALKCLKGHNNYIMDLLYIPY